MSRAPMTLIRPNQKLYRPATLSEWKRPLPSFQAAYVRTAHVIGGEKQDEFLPHSNWVQIMSVKLSSALWQMTMEEGGKNRKQK